MVFFSHTISMLSSKMTSIKIAEQYKEKQLHTLRRFLRQNGVSHSLSVRLHREVAERMSGGKKVLQLADIEVMDLISLPLRTALRQELCGRHLLNHPLFQLCARVDELMIQNMSMKAAPFVLAPGDSLFLAGTEGFAAYLNISGRSKYMQEILDGNNPRTNELEERQWVCEVVLWTIWMHVGTTEALTHSTFLSLEAAHFGSLLRSNTLWATFVREYGRLFHARVVSARPPAEDWPNDLEVPGATYGEILVSMPEEMRTLSGEIGLAELQNESNPMSYPWHGKELFDLQEEVTSGKSTLMVTGEGAVERVVALVTVALMLEEGITLVQVGEDKHGVPTPTIPVRLPGMKLSESMLASDCAKSIVTGRLSQLAPYVTFMESKRVLQKGESEKRGIDTHYINTKFVAKLNMDMALLEINTVSNRRYQRDPEASSMAPNHDIHHAYTDTISNKEILLIPDLHEDAMYYYTWMTEREFSMCRSGSSDSRQMLTRMFECLSNSHSGSSSMVMQGSNKSRTGSSPRQLQQAATAPQATASPAVSHGPSATDVVAFFTSASGGIEERCIGSGSVRSGHLPPSDIEDTSRWVCSV
mmetsp:Transcript_55051/g.123603  ORF Transcript_55051/g.123603 Transcript_55051/m.123603 type:complete len:587 (+) Transcript_55051:3-1763(+)